MKTTSKDAMKQYKMPATVIRITVQNRGYTILTVNKSKVDIPKENDGFDEAEHKWTDERHHGHVSESQVLPVNFTLGA